ncbi:hypothetical protein FHS66_002656 [Pacificitalea manganoxidans]|uniref:hypothetical protein n=1 Tax=Pacificitalea manganoxidans TaxID=1411902 RepID=UPI0012FD8E59|nr:hypothetical protein [Pacificitalea manganoxidans]MDR6309433.1 hypothetical protein [Pacificitalea manganoxidans]
MHTVWADLEKGTARYAVIGIDNGSGYKGNAAFDLQTGTVIGFSAHPVIGIIDARVVARTGGGYRCEVVFSRTSTAPKAIRIQSSIGEPIRGGSHGYDTDGDGVSGIYLYRAQLETGDTSTAFQKTDGDHLVIVEAGAPSFNYLRFDTVDDKLPQVMPDGLNGDVMIFGRKGAWIDTGVTIAPGGTLTAINGADSVGTAGIIPVLGDIVGWIALDRPITAWEQAQLLAYYAKRGAGGLYTLGPELVVNGTFDTDLSGWTLTTNATQSGGQALLGNEAYLRQPAIPSGTEGFAVIEWDQVITEGTRTRLRGRNENDSGYVDNVILGSVTISGYATGSGHFRAMVPTEDGYLLSLVTEGANSAQVDNLSVKRLVKS